MRACCQRHWRLIHLSHLWSCTVLFIWLFSSVLTCHHSTNNALRDSGASSLSEALKVNSTLTRLDLYWVFESLFWLFHFICNQIGEPGLSSLSELLEVNSTITSLNLGICSLLFDCFQKPFKHNLWILLILQECHFYQKHWKTIHPWQYYTFVRVTMINMHSLSFLNRE